jgi:hypothetical protein
MKKVALITIILLVCFSGFVFAEQSQSQTNSTNEVARPNGMPEIISLLATTPLYPEPDDKIKTWASLNPQDVKVIRTQFGDDNGYASPYGYTWIQIQTSWLGDRWIKVDNAKLGVIRPLNADLSLAVETPLYDHPYREAAKGARLSPQNVHAKAEFVTPSGLYAIQIETSWLGDQWVIQPEINNGVMETNSFPSAMSPDYGSLMSINGIRIIKLGEHTFAQGQLVIQKGAWEVGRLEFDSGEVIVSGKLSFWNNSGDVIAQIPYSVYAQTKQSMTVPILLPVDKDVSSAEIASLQGTFPFYFGLPVPPYMNLTDQDGKVWFGIRHQQKTGNYSIANAWSSGTLLGTHDYKLTLTFYGDDNQILGSAKVHQRMMGPLTPEQEGGGAVYSIDIVGNGDWTNYQRLTIQVDQVSDE